MIYVKLIKHYVLVTVLTSNKFLNDFNSTRQIIVVQYLVVIYVCLKTLDHRLIRLDCYYSRHVFKLSSEYAKLSRARPHLCAACLIAPLVSCPQKPRNSCV